jgi:hypothetical protein
MLMHRHYAVYHLAKLASRLHVFRIDAKKLTYQIDNRIKLFLGDYVIDSNPSLSTEMIRVDL